MGHGFSDIGDAWCGCVENEDFRVPGAVYEKLSPKNGALCEWQYKKKQILRLEAVNE